VNDDTIYAIKLVGFSILILLGLVGFILRLREVKAEKEKNK
jgi:preprotein translocase subunit Sss1